MLEKKGGFHVDNYANTSNCCHSYQQQTNHDQTKREANERKHRVSLSLADAIDGQSFWSAPDHRKDYGELREIGSAVVANRLYCIVFTQRGETFCMISLRKANAREIYRDEKATGIEP